MLKKNNGPIRAKVSSEQNCQDQKEQGNKRKLGFPSGENKMERDGKLFDWG